MAGFELGFFLRAWTKVLYAGLTCTFALGGAVIGSITGALKGQTTETGFFRGALIGAVGGAVLSVELLESLINGESLSKIAIFASLVNGKIFREWVTPAMLKAYQWQINMLDIPERESSDIFNIGGYKGMSIEIVQKLPQFEITRDKAFDPCGEKNSCSVCLQDFHEGESARGLPVCSHFFHVLCIDGWLVRHGSCPICRQDV